MLAFEQFSFMNLKSWFACVGVILGFVVATCMTSQAAQPSSTDSGRLVVERSPKLGSYEYLRLSIDGEMHNIGPGSRYDQPIPAGQHVLTLATPSNQQQPTSISLTVEPGQTYAFTATRGSNQGMSLLRSRSNP
jgi:hypothetical protein